jgi:hypothetical protein
MKALLFTLLLLFIIISPSLTALTRDRGYKNRQRIIYTLITPAGEVYNLEYIWDTIRDRLVEGRYAHMRFEYVEGGITRAMIDERRVDRWTFNTNPPGSIGVPISASVDFTRPLRSDDGTINPGVTVIDPRAVTLNERIPGAAVRGAERAPVELQAIPINFVFMTILPRGDDELDTITEGIIRTHGINAYLAQRPGSSSSQCPRLPLVLDAGIWVHLLANRMADYRPGEIQCEPAPEPDPRPHPDDACGSSNPPPRPRDPDDEGDPGAQGEAKRPRLDPGDKNFPDLNLPADQQETGRADQVGGTSQQKVIYDRPNPHVELQTNPFLFLIPSVLIYLLGNSVSPRSGTQQIRCHEVFRGSGHGGELRK